MGLARAFLTAVSRAVIGTQWPVGAEMASLMIHGMIPEHALVRGGRKAHRASPPEP